MSTNPYAAPTTHVADIPEVVADGNFIAEGRSRPAGNGWGWIKSARALTKPRSWLWMGVFIVYALIAMGLSIIPIVGPLALYFIMPVLFGGIMLTCDKARQGNEIAFGDVFAGFSAHFAKLAGIGLASLLMYLVIFAVIAAIFGTASALVLSGMEDPQASDPAVAIGIVIAALVMLGLSLPVYMAVWFSFALVTINNFTVVKALKTSFVGCLKNIVPFLIYGLMMFLFSILATIPLMLGWLILGPVLFASLYTGYRDIFYED
ncbi:MAG: hypothetical protein JSU95_10415 [Betaproteobacteria bacterium]|nr:MAG: hypothetical protein JSU95_10415 [Betaproteobacteria bacterium]